MGIERAISLSSTTPQWILGPGEMSAKGPIASLWILRELLGILILLGAIVYLPVVVSRWFSVQEVPFQNQAIPRNAIQLFPSRGEIRLALVASVNRQLEALRREDFEGAWELAARPLRQHMPVADFERMVKSGFAIMTQAHQVDIGQVFNNQEVGFVDVRLVSRESGTAYYSYYLVAGREGWLISGVEEQDPRRFEGPPAAGSNQKGA